MAYQALYRKYRPQGFDEVVGQDAITRILRAQVQTGRLSHAYLFTGSRGTGKTTCAKIMSKAVNCLEPIDGSPCNRCAACRSIDDGSCMDVLEIDAASNNGVDHVRDLRDDAIYSPASVRYRVYIVDEVHMLSIAAFNALLKIIEEPPEHLIFILATTELHKVPATILSRCQRFSFRRISPEDVAERLQFVAYQEGIDLEPAAAMVLGRMADGALRDGVSLLDQCASASVGAVTESSVYDCLGLAGVRQAAQMMAYVAEKNTPAALALYDKLYVAGKDVGALLDELCCLARDLLILKTAPKAGLSMLSGVSTLAEAEALRDKLSTGELVRIITLLQDTMSGFTRGGKTRLDGEVCVLRLCQSELSLDAEAMNARLSRVEEALASGVTVVKKEEAPKKASAPEDVPWDDRPPMPGDEDAPPEEGPVPVQEAPVGFWTDLVSKLRLELNPVEQGFFATGEGAAIAGVLKRPVLELQCVTTFVYDTVNKASILERIARIATNMLGERIRVVPVNLEKKPQASGRFQSLVEFGKQHQDVVKFK